MNIAEEIERVKTTMKRCKEQQQTNESDLKRSTQRIETLKEEISNQELKERDLIDNRDLKRIQGEAVEHQEKLDDLLVSLFLLS